MSNSLGAVNNDSWPRSDITPEQLLSYEAWWRDRYELLLSHGYQLRPRLRPGWVASWTTNGKPPIDCEDSIFIIAPKHNIVDAVRTSNDEQVLLKKVKTNGCELHLARYLSSPELREDPRNHCVPILDHFPDEEDGTISFLVMPLLREFDNPKFGSVNELLDFGDQIFEVCLFTWKVSEGYIDRYRTKGLCFLHAQGVAHRDCATFNIMMDARSMYPTGFHPVFKNRNQLGTETTTHYTRSERPPKYYFTDFGISSYFPSGSDPLVVGRDGRDFEVPELSLTVPYNPFKTDIFIIGNLLRKEFYYKYSNVDFLYPLILVMTEQDPKLRPTAFEAQAMWKYLKDSVSVVNRYWRLREREHGYMGAAMWDGISFVRRTLHVSHWAPNLDNMLT